MHILLLLLALSEPPRMVTLPNGGRVPCDHPLAIASGLTCATPKPVEPTSQVLTTGNPCEPMPNPYEEPERARLCVLSTITETPGELPAFVVGKRYTHVYGDRTILVLSVTRSLEGLPVATVQYVKGQPQGEASVFAFVVTAESGVWQ